MKTKKLLILITASLAISLGGCANMDADSTARTMEAVSHLSEVGLGAYDRYNNPNYYTPTVYAQPVYPVYYGQ